MAVICIRVFFTQFGMAKKNIINLDKLCYYVLVTENTPFL